MTPLESELGDTGAGGEAGDRPDGDNVRPSGGASGATGARGGTASVTAGRGGTSSGGTANASTGGAGGASVGGSSIGGAEDGGEGGSTCSRPATGDCHFAPLDVQRRCDDGASRAQSSAYRRLVGATSLADCEDVCLDDPDCSAVSDYLEAEHADRCYLVRGPCESPRRTDYSEEDAGKFYRKLCSSSSDCRFDYLGHWQRCETEPGPSDVVTGATSLGDCEDACRADSTCRGVVDYFWIAELTGCYLFTGNCCATAALPFGDPGMTYRKVCE
jgi:hypothetical protein